MFLRNIISEFLYLKKKRMGLAWLPGIGAWACQTETLGSGMFVKPKYLAYGMAQVPWV